MPAFDAAATAAFTITAYRYQSGESTDYYEVDDSVKIWAMTTLVDTSIHVESSVTLVGAVHTAATASVLALVAALAW